MKTSREKLSALWVKLYGNADNQLFDEVFKEIESLSVINKLKTNTADLQWYKNTVVYALYVDLFADNFTKLEQKLNYFRYLGISCLWLLPVLESPMRDAGFDVSNYRKIRGSLLGKGGDQSVFAEFVEKAHSLGIRIIFDIAINHTSDQHPWFVEAKKSEKNPYREYYIWSETATEYSDCRLLFEGMCPSNWEATDSGYYFHRFFEFQPDLNYKNPRVLAEMTGNFLFWAKQGVDGFRADAIPYLWKSEDTDCENLPETHLIVKFFRAALEFASPGTLLLAEACQAPAEVVKYLGNGDECQAAYHFPLMPMIFKSLATGRAEPVIEILKTSVTPAIPDLCQWFTFLRLHDEMSLEKVYVNEADRSLLHKYYCRKPEWDFRLGQGISARLSELMEHNPMKILLAFSIMLSLPGTPLIYYGDEFAKPNDESYFLTQSQITGYHDSRYYVRGKIDLEECRNKARENGTTTQIVFDNLRQMLSVRNCCRVFGNGDIRFMNYHPSLLVFQRKWLQETMIFVHNLSNSWLAIPELSGLLNYEELLKHAITIDGQGMHIEPHGFYWFRLKSE